MNYNRDTHIAVHIVFLLNAYVTPITLCSIIKARYPTLKFKIICNQLDGSTAVIIRNFERDMCTYTPIKEIKYDPLYTDNPNIVMGGWASLDKLEPPLLM